VTAARSSSSPTDPIRRSTTRVRGRHGARGAGCGAEALPAARGTDGYRLLTRQRQERGSALGELADLVWNTACEADRLHGKLRRGTAESSDTTRRRTANQTAFTDFKAFPP
jgi:hypothetical protein